jgi:hypothetical protein
MTARQGQSNYSQALPEMLVSLRYADNLELLKTDVL